MKTNRFLLAAGVLLALAFILSCDSGGGGGDNGNDGGGGGGDSALNGTWVSGTDKFVLNDGNITISDNNVEIAKGAYSTSGSNITITVSQVSGAVFGAEAADIGLSANTWYSQSSLRTAIINYFVSQGATQAQAETLYNQEMAGLVAALFATGTGTVTPNAMTVTIYGENETFTKQGSTGGNPGGGGYSGPLVGKWYYDQEDADKVGVAAAAGKLYTVSEYISLAQSDNLPDGAWMDGFAYDFQSNGTLIMGAGTLETTYTATANTITMSSYKPVDYTISGTELTITSTDRMTGFGLGEQKGYKPKR